MSCFQQERFLFFQPRTYLSTFQSDRGSVFSVVIPLQTLGTSASRSKSFLTSTLQLREVVV
ncbi:unnamed protein product [Amoebophrya sp. A25]|nr:unnamed protein product [Amoebophrya sp. A25]|eukprot:GSA25T00001652001.1